MYFLKIVGSPIFVVWDILLKVIEVTFSIDSFDTFSSY